MSVTISEPSNAILCFIVTNEGQVGQETIPCNLKPFLTYSDDRYLF